MAGVPAQLDVVHPRRRLRVLWRARVRHDQQPTGAEYPRHFLQPPPQIHEMVRRRTARHQVHGTVGEGQGLRCGQRHLRLRCLARVPQRAHLLQHLRRHVRGDDVVAVRGDGERREAGPRAHVDADPEARAFVLDQLAQIHQAVVSAVRRARRIVRRSPPELLLSAAL